MSDNGRNLPSIGDGVSKHTAPARRTGANSEDMKLALRLLILVRPATTLSLSSAASNQKQNIRSRKTRIIELMNEGLDDTEIAREMHISMSEVHRVRTMKVS